MDLGKAGGVLQFPVHLVLVAQLGAAGAVLFKLDGDLVYCILVFVLCCILQVVEYWDCLIDFINKQYATKNGN